MEAINVQRFSGNGASGAAYQKSAKSLKSMDPTAIQSSYMPDLNLSAGIRGPRGKIRKKGPGNMQMMMQFMMQLLQTLISLFQGMGQPKAPELPKTPPSSDGGDGTKPGTPISGDKAPKDTAPSPSPTPLPAPSDPGNTTPKPPIDSAPADPAAPSDDKPQPETPECGCHDTTPPPPAGSCRNLEAKVKENGQVEVKTKDGYTITCEGKDQAWIITSPSGKSTRIWGDPHVNESDGDKWDFTKQSSFRFGRNKITVEVTPYGDGGATLTKTITIYNGNDRITISGIDQNKPFISVAAADGKQHDAQIEDGDTYRLGKEKNGDDEWRKVRA